MTTDSKIKEVELVGSQNKLEIYYIYTFLLAGPLERETTLKALRDSYGADNVSDTSGQDRGFAPFLNTRREAFEITKPYPIAHGGRRITGLERIEEHEFEDFSCFIRLFSTGLGSIRFVLTVKGPLTTQEIIDLCDLAPAITTVSAKQHPTVDLGEKKERLNKLFEDEVRGVVGVLKVGWQDIQGVLVKSEMYDYEYPFVMTVIEGYSSKEVPLRSLYEDDADIEESKVKALRRQITALLVRLYDWQNINPKYLAKEVEGFRSFFPSSRIYLNIYPRSCLCIRETGKGGEDVENRKDLLKASIIDTVELLRTRWHSLVIVNSMISKGIADVYQRINGGNDTGQNTDSSWDEVLHQVIKLQRLAAITLEHPLSYRLAAGAFTELYQHGARRLGIDALQEVVNKKIHLLNSIHQHAFQVNRVSLIRELTTGLAAPPRTEEQ